MTTPTPQPLLDGLVFPEGPRWHEGKLWFSDMYGGRVMTVGLDGHAETVTELPERPSGLGFLPDGRLLVVSMRDRRLLRLDPDGLQLVADVGHLVTGDLNDMVVDARGRAYVGNFGFDLTAGTAPQPANLVLITPDGSARVVADNLMFPNGSVITPDGRTLIVAETFGNVLTAFDVEPSDGSLSNRRVYAHLGERGADGICLDAEGGVWLGTFGPEFVRVTEGGAVTHTIPMPGRMAVACMLGGEDRRTLFLLSAEGAQEDVMAGKTKGFIDTLSVETPGVGLP